MHAADVSVVHPLDPFEPTIGGFDTYVAGYLGALPAGQRVEVIGATADPLRRPVGRWVRGEVQGREVDLLPACRVAAGGLAGRLPLSLRFVLGAWRWRARPRGRVVHYHRFESTLAPGPSEERRRVLFSHSHPPMQVNPSAGLAWRWLPGLHRRALLARVRRMDQVWVADGRTLGWFADELGPDLPPAGRVHLWAPPEIHRPRSVAVPGLPEVAEDEVWVAVVGRLAEQKDPRLALDAFLSLAGSRPGWNLVFVGDGPLEAALRRRAAAAGDPGLSQRVHFAGLRSREEVWALLDRSHVLLISSRTEGGPFVAFEALACGATLACTPVGHVHELIRDGQAPGAVADAACVPEVAGALAQAVDLAVQPGARERAVEAARTFTPARSLAAVLAADVTRRGPER